ncbi:hypothetical protein MMM127_02860 [Helicobacter pylori]
MGIKTKSIKSRVWIHFHVDNKNTQRPSKINIKDLHQTQAIIFKALLRGFNGVKRGCYSKSPYPL